MTILQGGDDPTEPVVTPELHQQLSAPSKTAKLDPSNLELETKYLPGNAILQSHTPVTFVLIGTEIVLTVHMTKRLVIGRYDLDTGEKVDIDLTPYGGKERGVSRCHAGLYRTTRTVSLFDLNSTNGTYLNGTRLAPHQPRLLRDGDEICFGNMRFQLRFAHRDNGMTAAV